MGGVREVSSRSWEMEENKVMNVNEVGDRTVPNSLSQGSDTALGSSRRRICMPVQLFYGMTLVLGSGLQRGAALFQSH